mgnify:FL=1
MNIRQISHIVTLLIICFPMTGYSADVDRLSFNVKAADEMVGVQASGTIVAMNELTIGSEVSGRIVSIDVEPGDEVSAGQTLVKLDSNSISLKIRLADAKLEVSRLKLEQSKSELEKYKLSMKSKRIEALIAKNSITKFVALYEIAKRRAENSAKLADKGAVSNFDSKNYLADQTTALINLDNARNEVERIEIDIEKLAKELHQQETGALIAKADISVNEEELNLLKDEMKRTIIKSPFNGIVLERLVEEGQVLAAQFQTPVLLRIAKSLDRIKIKALVPESDINKVKTSQSIYFTTDFSINIKRNLNYVKINPYPVKHDSIVLYEVELLGENSDGSLLPGMTATVTFENKSSSLLVLPEPAFVILTTDSALLAVIREGKSGRAPCRERVEI